MFSGTKVLSVILIETPTFRVYHSTVKKNGSGWSKNNVRVLWSYMRNRKNEETYTVLTTMLNLVKQNVGAFM